MKKKKKFYKLPKKFARKWLVALRSGDYNQVNKVLYNPKSKGFCCLGVAGHICGISERSLNNKSFINTCNYSESTVRKYIRMGYPKELTDNILLDILANMNDQGKSFKQIALWIDRNIEFY